MIVQILLLTTGIAIFAATANAEPGSKPPAHTPEWTNPASGDPGRSSTATAAVRAVKVESEPAESVIPELAGIVVLCAQDGHGGFEDAWVDYVRDNQLKGAELQRTIKYVVNQAGALRAERRAAKQREMDARWARDRHRHLAKIAGGATTFKR